MAMMWSCCSLAASSETWARFSSTDSREVRKSARKLSTASGCLTYKTSAPRSFWRHWSLIAPSCFWTSRLSSSIFWTSMSVRSPVLSLCARCMLSFFARSSRFALSSPPSTMSPSMSVASTSAAPFFDGQPWNMSNASSCRCVSRSARSEPVNRFAVLAASCILIWNSSNDIRSSESPGPVFSRCCTTSSMLDASMASSPPFAVPFAPFLDSSAAICRSLDSSSTCERPCPDPWLARSRWNARWDWRSNSVSSSVTLPTSLAKR
mmetsp:Transcript_17767/g.42524  ORF Transcript_17767/g.42524 Transcript_17767/m.42524 type:complete len:264 (+) Transcript_17767:1264-2055(+)